MVEYEETSSLQVLGTVTADATITVFFGLFSFDGSIHDALFPKGLFTTQLAASATLLDVLVMLLVRATLAASAVTGTRQCTSRYGLILVFSLHCAMAIWYDTDPAIQNESGLLSNSCERVNILRTQASACRSATKAVLAAQNVHHALDIQVPGSDAVIHVWYLYITLIMGAVFGFAEHSLCVAWAATFRGESWIELSHYRGAMLARHRSMQGRTSPCQEPLLPNVAPNVQTSSAEWDPLQ